MSDFDLEFGVRVNGVDSAINDARRVQTANEQVARGTQQAAQQTARAAQTSSQAISQLGTSMQQVGQRTGQTISALGAFATSLGDLSPAGRAAGAVISQLGGAVSALSGAMGPFGVALGVATLALNAYRAATDNSAEANARAQEETRQHRIEVDRLAASARTASANLASLQASINERDAEARSRRLAQGGFESGEDARLQAERLRRGAADAARLGGTAAELFAGAEEEAAALEAQAAAGAFDQQTQQRRGGGGGARAQRDTFRSDNGAALRQMIADADAGGADALTFAAGLGTDAYSEKAEERFEAEKERAREMAEIQRQAIEQQRELADAAKDAATTFGDSWRSSIDDVIEAWRDAREAQQRAGQAMLSQSELMRVGMTSVGNEIANVVGGTMVGAFESALGAWLDGSKSFVEAAEDMVKGVLKALVIESIVQAVTETARGIADLAGYKYDTAALHFAAAAAWGAVGVAAGAVGGAIGAFGGGGKDAGGAGASQSVTPTDASTTAAPSQPVTINVYPGGFITRRDMYAGVVDALNESAREGYRVDPSLIGG